MRKNVEVPFELNPVPMFLYRRDNLQIIEANHAALSMYGYSLEHMLQMTIKDLRPEKNVQNLMRFLEEAPSQIRDSGVREHQKADGQPLYVRVISQPYRDNGEYRLVMLQDVTSEVLTNRKNHLLSLLARNTNNGVVITDHNKKIEWVNDAWVRMSGFSLEEVRGRYSGRFLQGEETSSDTIDYMSDQMDKEEGFTTKVLNYRKDGTPFWNNLEVLPVHDDEGELIHWIGIKEDITGQVEAQRQAEESRTLFFNALKLAPIPILLRDEEGNINFVNKAFEKASGYKLEDIPDVNQWVEKAHPHTKEEALQSIAKVFDTDEIYYGGDHPVYTKDGDKRVWEFWDAPLGYIHGRQSQSAIVMALDVTELRFTKQQLELELTKFRQLFEYSPNALAITDADGNIQEVNDEFERFFGYGKHELGGRQIDRLLTSDKSECERAIQKTRSINENRTFWEEATRYTRNGKPVPVFIGGIPVSINDEVKFQFHIYSDISRVTALLKENQRLFKQEQSFRAKAEESRAQFKDMFEEAPAGIALVEGPEHVYSYANTAYGNMMGWKHHIGRPLAEISPEAKEQGYIELLDQVYQSGQVYSAKEQYVKVYQNDGSTRELYRNFTYKPLKDEKGDTYAILIHAVDVSDQVEFRQQIESQLKEKSMLLDEIHHRVKNNLAVITSLLYLQQEESDSSKVKENLQEAQNRIQSIALVHEQLYRQAESGVSIQMDHYLDSLMAWLRQTSEPPGTALNIRAEANNIYVPLSLAVPFGMMATELITNACKHAFKEKVEGTIQVTLSKDQNYYYLEVADDGCGLPEEFSLESGRTGMDIINSLLVQLNADLSHHSKPGEGTTFTIQIPVDSQ